MFKELYKGTFIYSIAPQFSKVASLFLLPILTKYLTAFDYGINALILAYLGAFAAFKMLGLNVILTNSFFRYPKKFILIWKKIYGFIKIWSLLFGLLLIPILLLILPEEIEQNKFLILFLIIIPIVLFEPTVNIGLNYLQLSKRPKPVAVFSIISSALSLAFCFYSIVYLHLGYIGFLIGNFVASFISSILYGYIVLFKEKIIPSFKLNFNWLKRKLKISLPTIPHFYAAYLLGVSDKVILDFYNVGTSKIGLYAFAYSFGIYFSILGKGFWKASGPYYMEEFKKESVNGDLSAKKITNVSQALLIFFGGIICFWVKEIFQIISSNDELADAYFYAIPIILAYTYHPIYSFASMKIWYDESTKKFLKISFLAGALCVGLNFILIPYYGIIASTIITFFSYMFLAYIPYTYKSVIRLFNIKYNPFYWIIIIVCVGIISFKIQLFSFGFKLLFSFIFTMILLLYLKKKLNE